MVQLAVSSSAPHFLDAWFPLPLRTGLPKSLCNNSNRLFTRSKILSVIVFRLVYWLAIPALRSEWDKGTVLIRRTLAGA